MAPYPEWYDAAKTSVIAATVNETLAAGASDTPILY